MVDDEPEREVPAVVDELDEERVDVARVVDWVSDVARDGTITDDWDVAGLADVVDAMTVLGDDGALVG